VLCGVVCLAILLVCIYSHHHTPHTTAHNRTKQHKTAHPETLTIDDHEVPGFRLPNTLRLDVMHIWDLGNTARWHGICMRRLIALNHWPGTTKDEQIVNLVRELRVHYTRHALAKTRKLSRTLRD
jgi:hypothetical protein